MLVKSLIYKGFKQEPEDEKISYYGLYLGFL